MANNRLSTAFTQKHIRHTFFALVALVAFLVLFQLQQGYNPDSQQLSNWGSVASTSADEGLLGDVFNATLGFEKILAINLPERTDHHDGLVLAAAVSGLQVEFVDGVRGDSVAEKALPLKHTNSLHIGVRGAWRAHMNAISRVVENNWSSALILEDDADWDIRIKSQMRNIAIASEYLIGTDRFNGVVPFEKINARTVSKASPFGEGWDVLWLGHCGMELPPTNQSTVVLLENDITVPEPSYYRCWDPNAISPLSKFPLHSRAVMQQYHGTCSLAYAVSQQGARKLLYSLGLGRMDDAFDMMVKDWCQGTNDNEEHVCIGTLPMLFDHHRGVGHVDIDSDIEDHSMEPEIREKAFTTNIRWSVRLNMEKLLKGDHNFTDQWPDLLGGETLYGIEVLLMNCPNTDEN